MSPRPPGAGGPESGRIRAAQYLRVSSDSQIHSLENQAATLAAYAQAHGYDLVVSYEDVGLSGVTAERRPALRRLLADVIGGEPDFQAILVYDISRWGRFPNADESAHYEFVCRQEGVEVVYCAEPFRWLDAVSTAVLKQVKRVMAAEYSRHLSLTVSTAQRRGAAAGFWQCGEPGYGLRRALIDADGQQVGILGHGERKAIQSQRVLLVPGPPEEQAVVREIYRLFLDEDLSRADIVRRLNHKGVPHSDGGRWTFQKVHHVLTSPSYVGDQVYGRFVYGGRGPQRRRPPADWVVAKGVLAPLVSRALQARARRKIANTILILDDAEMLRRLAELLKRKGRLSADIIKAAEGLPCPASYRSRFGGLPAAYARIGYEPKPRQRAPSR